MEVAEIWYQCDGSVDFLLKLDDGLHLASYRKPGCLLWDGIPGAELGYDAESLKAAYSYLDKITDNLNAIEGIRVSRARERAEAGKQLEEKTSELNFQKAVDLEKHRIEAFYSDKLERLRLENYQLSKAIDAATRKAAWTLPRQLNGIRGIQPIVAVCTLVCGVYFLCDAEEEIVYVGQSVAEHTRLYSLHNNQFTRGMKRRTFQEKYCLICGRKLAPNREGINKESPSAFAKRRFCGCSCAGVWRRGKRRGSRT